MNKTENRKDEFDLALENMKLEPEADLDRLIEKRGNRLSADEAAYDRRN